MWSLHKNIQWMLEFLKASLLVLYLFFYTLMTCDVVICVDDTTLYSKCDQVYDLRQQLELASVLESDLWKTVDWDRKWPVDFNGGKNQLVFFDRSNNTGAILMWKWMGKFLIKYHVLRCWGWLPLLKLDWGSYIIFIAKTASKKIGVLICSVRFLSPELLCISINLSYSYAWNNVIISGLVLLVAAWKY